MNQKTRTRVRFMTTTALFAALAAVLQFFELSLPFMPGILKLEFSDLPALMAAFTLGPWAGVVVELLKNCVHLFVTWSMGVGELCNFLLGALFVLPAGLLYKRFPSFRGALVGSLTGLVCMAAGSIPINGWITYPFYAAVMMPMDTILDMYRALNPNVETLWQALTWFNMPFTALKGLCSVVVTLPLYRRLIPLIRKGS